MLQVSLFFQKKTFFWTFLFLSILFFSFRPTPLKAASEGDKVNEYITSHVTDSDHWLPLPFHLIEFSFPKFSVGSYRFENGLHGVMLVIAMFLLILFFGILYEKNGRKAPKRLTNLLETLVLFVRDSICIEHLGKKDGRNLAPVFLTFFFFILFLNLMGLVPLFSTATANLNVTAGFALITLSMIIAGGIIKNGVMGFLKMFVPPGVPTALVPLLFPIELVGLFVKPFALTIRLFANMLAGHIVVYSIVGLIVIYGAFGLPSLLLGVFIYLLEILVAFIQAYIFTLLSAIFVGEALNPHH